MNKLEAQQELDERNGWVYIYASRDDYDFVVKQCLEGGEGERGVARSLSFELAILNHVPIIAVAVTGPSLSAFPNTCSFLYYACVR